MKKKVMIVSIMILFISGFALLFNKQISNWLVQKKTSTYQVQNFRREELEANRTIDAEFDFEAVEELDETAVYRTYSANDLPIIGGIAVPSVGIHLPIFRGLEEANLVYGAGTMYPDQQMGEGNYSLASHRSINPSLRFTPLERVEVGEVVYLTDLESVYTYRITLVEHVLPTATHFVQEVPGEKLLTLVTCGESEGVTRIIVQAELEEIVAVSEQSEDQKAAFSIDPSVE